MGAGVGADPEDLSGGYRERPSRLRGAVLWTHRARAHATAPYPVLPDGCMDLLWSDGRLLVAGPDTRAYQPGPRPGGALVAGVRLAPGTAPALLGVPAHELRDQRVDLADLWPSADARRHAERVHASGDPAAALEALAVRLAASAAPPNPLLLQIAADLDTGRTVADTAARAGLGARRLHRLSLAAFGYGPKTLARVLRLQRALALARTGLPYADTAAAVGFADQAHLARDFRDLAGLPLTDLLSARP
ncbi:helix-turn-helix transcriptional regulator [Streptomyces apocyni]|uniref:helix-turn-helix transcriptional regulator n=1 Tax=Streptomyces apocyni TaxID=2654677 RepID=UPI001E4001EC|nr:helix-turn-helix transcriptional regulator [Streptomyces apocyni]